MSDRARVRPSLVAARALTGPGAFLLAGVLDWGRLVAVLVRRRLSARR